MKRFSIWLALLLVVAFSLPASASAATSPGIKPGGFFYFFDTTFEKIGLFFTFSPEKKAKKALEYADERLAEAGAVTDNAEAVKTAITNYESNIAFAEEKSKDVGDKEKAEALLTSIADNTSKHQEVLTAVLVKVPDEAKEAIIRAIEASRKGHEEAMKKIAELKGEVEQLKQEVSELKAKDEEREKIIEELSKQKTESPVTQQKISNPQTSVTPAQKLEIAQPQTSPKPEPTKITSIATLPNGAVVEMDDNGKILRYIKEAPMNTTTQTPTTPVAPPPTAPQTQTETLEITSVSVTPDTTSAKIEWQTNKPTESKVFISGGNLSSKIFTSVSGLSTRHIATLTGLSGGITYSYEIEAIANATNVVKKQGSFDTISPPPPPPPPAQTEIVQTQFSENGADYTFYNRTNKYIGYTFATIKVWQSKIVNPHERVRVEVYMESGLVSPKRQVPSGVNEVRGDFTVSASSITGTSEDTATTITVPLPNESSIYCNNCGHMVIPTARANYSKDVAAYIRLETHADDVDNPNDRYFVKLISFGGETFGTQPAYPNSGGTIYTF